MVQAIGAGAQDNVALVGVFIFGLVSRVIGGQHGQLGKGWGWRQESINGYCSASREHGHGTTVRLAEQTHQSGKADIAIGKEHGALRLIQALSEGHELLVGVGTNGVGLTQRAMPKGVPFKQQVLELVVDKVGGRVVIAFYLVAYHLYLFFHLGLWAGAMKHHVGEQVDSTWRIFAQYGGMIHGGIFVGVGVQVAPYPLEIVDDGCRRATLGALKRHVLVIVGHALFIGALVAGDMTTQETKDKIFAELTRWEKGYNITDLDVLIATPPCQGMSVANHKKKDELKRNSLVVESIKMTQQIKPKFFIYENVRAFLSSVCTDIDGKDKTIKEAIDTNLSGNYNILYRVLNFKEYGNPSSRTRTLVIGVRKDIKEVTPFDVFPDKQPEKTLRQTIGHLPSLVKMGEIWDKDIYHNFRKYSAHMEAWIADIKEGQSAFDNTDISKIPHTVKDGVIVYNAKKNGDKYTRQYWDKVAPCIHTRNDILASQNTVHPSDNRVFSIREVMLMMSVPASFVWTDIPFSKLNAMSDKQKQDFLKKEEMNIRQNLGEAVPTIIFRQIAHKIKKVLCSPILSDQDIANLIKQHRLTDHSNLLNFISNSCRSFVELSKIAELSNAQRDSNAAYYTRQDICYTIIKNLPDAKNYDILSILEPAIGVGNFLPTLIQKYEGVPQVNIDVIDIDANSIEILKALVAKLNVPANIHINYICADFLLYNIDKHYDIIVGNPPYKKITKDNALLAKYKHSSYNTETNNIFSFFIEKSMQIGDIVSLIVPKSLINAPEFNLTRKLMTLKHISHILDFGEKGFKGVKIETICFVIDNVVKSKTTRIESYITNSIQTLPQSYWTDEQYPYWLIYR